MSKVWRFLFKNSDVIAVGIIMTAVFFYIMFMGHSDLPPHAGGAIDMLESGRLFAGNFLMYFLVNLLTCFTGAAIPVKIALVLLVAIANVSKYLLVRNEMAKKISLNYSKCISASLLFVYIIPVMYFLKVFGVFSHLYNMYYGYYVPNVWHNSTILCAMPFAIVTFFLSLRQFKEYDRKRNGLISLFVALGVLVKPSFFFVYGVAYPICMFIKYWINKEFLYSLIPVLIGWLCVLYVFLTTYDGSDGTKVVVSFVPLFTLEFWQSNGLYFLVSMSFPALFVLFYWKNVSKDLAFWFVLIMLVVAVGIRWCCLETGERAIHGNFCWQVIPAMWFVFYYMINRLIEPFALHLQTKVGGAVRVLGWKNTVFIVLYGLHVVMGGGYLVKYLVTNSYW